MELTQKVEKAIKRIDNRVKKETGESILDFLYSAVKNYEYNEDGEKASTTYIINRLENEADKFIDIYIENNIKV